MPPAKAPAAKSKPVKLTPGMRQWHAVKAQFPDHLLLFRMGDFYETFHGDAVEAARVLGITLTKRGEENGKPIPLAGIPYHALETYLGRLVRAGKRLAICEQVEDPKRAKGIVRREVVRVVTPGTLTEDALLEEGRNNFLAAVIGGESRWGLALTDLSTGALRLTVLQGAGATDQLRGELCRFSPSEVLVPDGCPEELRSLIGTAIDTTFTPRPPATFEHAGVEEAMESIEDLPPSVDPSLARSAACALVAYLRETQCSDVAHMQMPVWYRVDDHLTLDATTQRSLELAESTTPGVPGANLLAVLDQSKTAMGKRCLRSWLLRPLRRLSEIQQRLDSVEALVADYAIRHRLGELLRQIADLERIMGRVGTQRANARDLVALGHSLDLTPRVQEATAGLGGTLGALVGEWVDASPLRARLAEALVDEPPVTIHDGGMIRDGFSAELDELRSITRDIKGWIKSLQRAEIERTGIQSLKIGFNRVFGYYLEVTKANAGLVPESWIRKQTLVNAERYITPELKEKEEVILQADEKINEIESRLFEELRQEVASQARQVQQLASQVATVDALLSLANAAVSGGYTRPEVVEEAGIEIQDGRHPVLETLALGGPFVPNSTSLTPDSQQIMVITGPNMAGKSTYIRQVALITVMAQMGSFVPARRARIGLVDRVFTRVGASDQLARGQSTFLVEMSETANILHHATDRSLVILDEIGRGTSTFDGLSIAWAVLEYLHATRGCRPLTLFATHYHELAELEGRLERVRNFNVAVHETEGEITFLFQVVPGHTDHSYGIYAAKVAGLPNEAISRAQEILFQLECGHSPADGNSKPDATQESAYQLTLFDSAPHPAVDRLRQLDPGRMTPMDALVTLDELVKLVQNR